MRDMRYERKVSRNGRSEASGEVQRGVQTPGRRDARQRQADVRDTRGARPRQLRLPPPGEGDPRERLDRGFRQPDPRGAGAHRAAQGEPPARDGGRYFKAGSADIRAKAAATTSNAGRCPTSAQCGIPGAPRSTYHAVRGREEAEPGPGPLAEDVAAAHRDGRGRCGTGKIERAPAKKGKAASRRRITRIVKGNSLAGAYARARFEPHADGPNEAGLPNVLDRELDG